LVGKNLYQSDLGSEYDIIVISIIRNDQTISQFHRDLVIEQNDCLVIECSAQNLLTAQEALKFEIQVDQDFRLNEFDTGKSSIFEATLSPRSTIVGKTLNEVKFRDRFGFSALAIWRDGGVITQNLRDVRLRFGDALLLIGTPGRLEMLQRGNEFLVLEPIEVQRKRKKKAPIAAGIMLLVIALAIFSSLGIATSMVIGSVLMVITGCLSMDEAYESIDWRTVFLVGGMLSLGIAMENTGTAQYLANILLDAFGGFGPIGLLAGIYLLSALITQPMSNAAAIVLMVPIAVDTALGLNVNHLTFTMAVVIGAATSFITPVGHKANVLVFGPGGYRFLDYTKVGILLTVFLFIVSMIFLPILWPF
jgi:di/tricarboxylate transporter